MRAPCNACGVDSAAWVDSRRGAFQRHDDSEKGCRFPCRRKCDHLDCAEERGDLEEVASRLGISVYDGETGEPIYEHQAEED